MNDKPNLILITGSTGLVGARLLRRLLQAGWKCRTLLRDTANTAPGAIPVRGDLLDPAALAEAVKDVTAVVHLAAVFRTPDDQLIWKSNLDGTRNLIDAVSAMAPQARFIFASTAHVYDAGNPHPGREDDTISPGHAYPASKVAAEKLLQDSGLNWSILRFPFVYGDGDGHLESLPKHLETLNWHPAARMSTVHHRDIHTAMQLALDGVMDGRIVNIADDAAISVYELVKLTGGAMESSATPLSNPWHLHIDTTLARSLGFQPSVPTVFDAVRAGLL